RAARLCRPADGDSQRPAGDRGSRCSGEVRRFRRHPGRGQPTVRVVAAAKGGLATIVCVSSAEEALKMTKHRIAVIPGDGIGKEVVPEGIRVLDAAAVKYGLELEGVPFPWSWR